jgi:hypothetical protein
MAQQASLRSGFLPWQAQRHAIFPFLLFAFYRHA